MTNFERLTLIGVWIGPLLAVVSIGAFLLGRLYAPRSRASRHRLSPPTPKLSPRDTDPTKPPPEYGDELLGEPKNEENRWLGSDPAKSKNGSMTRRSTAPAKWHERNDAVRQ